MSLVRKMQEGAKTPTLYTMYGKQYDFDELQRVADLGLAEHLSTLKRGSKDESKFRDAYNNIMVGIRDGSITFLDGRFIDTKYGYHNSSDKDKNKDHYGLMANYIFNKMGKSPEYVKPEDKTKTKWAGSSSIGLALIKELYNSDSENIQDFIDVDEYDEATKTRGTSGRTQRLSQAFLSVLNNFDTLFTEYTDTDKTNATAYISDAIKYLNDGSIDAGDYLALNRAASGLNYRGMFSGEYSPSQSVLEMLTPGGETQSERQAFLKWISEKYPQFIGTLNSRSLSSTRRYPPEVLQKMLTAISGLGDTELYNMLKSYIRDPNIDFNRFPVLGNTFGDANYGFQSPLIANAILQALKEKKLLLSFGDENNLNLHYILNTENSDRQTGWVWDDKAGELKEMSYHDIPYWREKIKQEWLASRNGYTENPFYTSRYFPQYKSGGVLKAELGTVMDRNAKRGPGITGDNPWLALPNTTANARNTNTWGKYYNNPAIDNDIKAAFNWRPRPEFATPTLADDDPNASLARLLNFMDILNGNYPQAQLDNYISTNYGADPVHKFWEYGYKVDSEGHPLKDGKGNYLYGLSGLEVGQLLNDLENIGSNLPWTAKLNDAGYEEWNKKFDQTGLNVYFGGDSEKFGSMGPSTQNRHDLIERMKETYDKEHPWTIGDDKLYWNNHSWVPVMPDLKPELPGVKATIDPAKIKLAPIKTDTKIDLTTGDENKPKGTGSGFLNTLAGIAPDVMAASRLAISLNTNNRVAKEIRKSLTPVLKNTYERFSPITGDWATRQSAYSRAGSIQSKASKPLTSDASLHTNTMLDASRQATALRTQGDLADNQKVRRTSAEALARVEDNMARRLGVANFNRASINLTNREIAQLEATRLKFNWQSWDNFLGGVEGRLRTKYDTDKSRRDNFRLTVAANGVENTYQERIKDANAQVEAWRAAHPGVSVITMPGYRQYEELIKEATRWKNAETYAAHASIYGDSYVNPYANQSWADTAAKYSFKSGGTLRPSALYLINKVIRNESNT